MNIHRLIFFIIYTILVSLFFSNAVSANLLVTTNIQSNKPVTKRLVLITS